jgi:Tfp pilus assembly protein PilV
MNLRARRHAKSQRLDRDRCAGFTILEVAMAALVMAMGISTSIVVMQRGFAMIDSARNLTTAGQILSSQMEQLRMYDWTTVAAYPTAETTVSVDPSFTATPEVADRYTLKRRVEVITADLLQITFTLTWRNYDGRTLSRAMTTYYAHYGIHDFIYNHSS